MSLKIYNTLSGKKEEFVPIKPGKVSMYVCGPTVYDTSHIGHARSVVVFDMVYRWLTRLDYDVTYVRNFTDVDDKIIKKSNEIGESCTAITEKYIDEFHNEMDALNVLRPTAAPKATEHIDHIIRFIQMLIDKDKAYHVAGGDVYFSIKSFGEYGKLSGRNPDDMQAGARIAVDEKKRSPLDFTLWKPAKAGEPYWESPWGNGRPGWHIECSAMSYEYLGEGFDIHGGGKDLIFPHHENEIAQSEGATGEPFVNVWMHNGFVRIDDEKMSKSLGNFFTVRDILARYQPEVVRYFMLTSHYRSPLNYSDHDLESAKQSVTRLYTALRGLPDTGETDPNNGYNQRFQAAMNDDFNTPEVLAVLFDLVKEINRLRLDNLSQAAALGHELRRIGGILGLLLAEPDAYLQGAVLSVTEVGLSVAKIEQLIAERQAARTCRDWGTADEIRTYLKENGIILDDGTQGTTWRKV